MRWVYIAICNWKNKNKTKNKTKQNKTKNKTKQNKTKKKKPFPNKWLVDNQTIFYFWPYQIFLNYCYSIPLQ